MAARVGSIRATTLDRNLFTLDTDRQTPLSKTNKLRSHLTYEPEQAPTNRHSQMIALQAETMARMPSSQGSVVRNVR